MILLILLLGSSKFWKLSSENIEMIIVRGNQWEKGGDYRYICIFCSILLSLAWNLSTLSIMKE